MTAPYTQHELEEMLADLESDLVERKESLQGDNPRKITNPGGPYGALTAENFGQPGIVDYRNRILAEAMRVVGPAQRYGAGLPTARRALLNNGQAEPAFRVEPNWVQCTVGARR